MKKLNQCRLRTYKIFISDADFRFYGQAVVQPNAPLRLRHSTPENSQRPMPNPQHTQFTEGTDRKRSVNLILNAALVAEAKLLSPNLSATVESLLVAFVASERQARSSRQLMADQYADDWNSILDHHGSFADSHAASRNE